MQEQLRTYRRIFEDLAIHSLEPLPGGFARLAYLAALRDPATGKYRHSRLSPEYGEEPAHQALSRCHEELFERYLELPLAEQQQEFQQFLESAAVSFPNHPSGRQLLFDSWIPPKAPDYLKELFRSNLQALSVVVRERGSTARSDT